MCDAAHRAADDFNIGRNVVECVFGHFCSLGHIHTFQARTVLNGIRFDGLGAVNENNLFHIRVIVDGVLLYHFLRQQFNALHGSRDVIE